MNGLFLRLMERIIEFKIKKCITKDAQKSESFAATQFSQTMAKYGLTFYQNETMVRKYIITSHNNNNINFQKKQ